MRAPAKTLSGGQKRKLQLGMMLTGGSAVCCVDEVSSGLDPLSRRKIWDILLAERGRRTIIMTTHFLDEADLLADHIAIMSKGRLRAEGASVQLKDRLGGGYRIHVQHVQRDRHDHPARQLPDVDGVAKKAGFDSVTYVAPSSSLAARVIQALEALGVHDYRFSGPTIEDVFLQLAEEVRAESSSQSQSSGSHPTFLSSPPGAARSEKVVGLDDDPDRTVEKEEEEKEEEDDRGGLQLLSGQPIGYLRQTGVLFLKRCTIFKGNWFPYAAAFLIPVVAAGLVTLFVRDQQPVGCTPGDQSSLSTAIDIFSSDFDFFLVGGPSSRFHTDDLLRLFLPLFERIDSLLRNITTVDTYGEFTDLVVRERKNVTPAGIWLGDATSAPTVAYKANGIEMFDAWFGQWVLDMLLANTTIASSYVTFDIPWAPSTGKSLQLLVYVGLALSAYPGFFALYPNLERRRHVRGLEYSNGVRTAPLWLAYIAFDFAIVLVSTAAPSCT
ncbi:hypothetical protein VTK73DRAFT_3147 [Phialemonium thermophilum]|uniref:ABC transporter domain-containing protein n=1 Tax=Phialemonium thermophilum TaxID=223376 RepID=A0ABR3VKV5_9PEZI